MSVLPYYLPPDAAFVAFQKKGERVLKLNKPGSGVSHVLLCGVGVVPLLHVLLERAFNALLEILQPEEGTSRKGKEDQNVVETVSIN